MVGLHATQWNALFCAISLVSHLFDTGIFGRVDGSGRSILVYWFGQVQGHTHILYWTGWNVVRGCIDWLGYSARHDLHLSIVNSVGKETLKPK